MGIDRDRVKAAKESAERAKAAKVPRIVELERLARAARTVGELRAVADLVRAHDNRKSRLAWLRSERGKPGSGCRAKGVYAPGEMDAIDRVCAMDEWSEAYEVDDEVSAADWDRLYYDEDAAEWRVRPFLTSISLES